MTTSRRLSEVFSPYTVSRETSDLSILTQGLSPNSNVPLSFKSLEVDDLKSFISSHDYTSLELKALTRHESLCLRWPSYAFNGTRQESQNFNEWTLESFHKLVQNKTHNFNLLLLHLISNLRIQRLNAYHGDWSVSAYNSLFLVRVFCKHLIENQSNSRLLNDYFELDRIQGSSGTTTSYNAFEIEPIVVNDKRFRSEQLLEELVQVILLSTTSSEMNYNFYVECLELLIVLFSGQMLVSPSSSSVKDNLFLKLMMDNLTHFSRGFIGRLLMNFLQQQVCPRDSQSVFSSAYKLFFTPIEEVCTLSDKSTILILLLCNQDPIGIPNGFRSTLSCLVDLQGSQTNNELDYTIVCISFRQLFTTICKTLDKQETSLLLYMFLHKNKDFNRFVLSRIDQETLTLPLLKIIYQAIESKDHYSQLYMLLTVLLVMTQDEIFNEAVHKLDVPIPHWYSEKSVKSLSVGGMIMLVILKTIQSNLSKHKDVFIHVNSLAILGNMSSFVVQIPSIVSSRLISVFEMVSKRYFKLTETVGPSVQESLHPKESTTIERAHSQESRSNQFEKIHLDIIILILEIINSILTHNLHHNPHLIYALLLGKETFYKFRLNPKTCDLIENIDTVLTHFQSKLMSVQDLHPSATQVFQVIQEASTAWTFGKLRLFSDLKFEYQEEQEYSRFFLPYIWSLVHVHSHIHWDKQKLELILDWERVDQSLLSNSE